MNISNERDVMIFKNEYGKYTVGVSKKNQDDTYENAYFPIEFNKGEELENGTKIRMNRAWLSFYKWEREGQKGTKFFIRCSDYSVVEQDTDFNKVIEDAKIDPFAEFGEQVQLEDTDFEFPF